MSWGTVLSIVGTAASLYGSSQSANAASSQADAQAAEIRRAAAANAAISRYDAAVARGMMGQSYLKTNTELSQLHQAGDIFLSTQKARFGKSGVAVSTGTPLETMVNTHDEFLKDAKIIAYEGLKEMERAGSLASRYDMLADSGLRDAAAQASLTIKAGQDKSQAYLIKGAAEGASNIYNLGYDQGWWN